jgi:hypothetical protein
LRSILDSPCDRAVFDSIHVFDVRQNNWCGVAWIRGRGSLSVDEGIPWP